MNTCLEVAASRAARQCSSVDIPEPDEPMIATKSPLAHLSCPSVAGSKLGISDP